MNDIVGGCFSKSLHPVLMHQKQQTSCEAGHAEDFQADADECDVHISWSNFKFPYKHLNIPYKHLNTL